MRTGVPHLLGGNWSTPFTGWELEYPVYRVRTGVPCSLGGNWSTPLSRKGSVPPPSELLLTAFGPAPNTHGASVTVHWLSASPRWLLSLHYRQADRRTILGLPTFPPIPAIRVQLQRGTGWLLKPGSTYRSEGLEDFFQDFLERFLAAGRDVVLRQLQEGQAVLALAPHVLRPMRQGGNKEHSHHPTALRAPPSKSASIAE